MAIPLKVKDAFAKIIYAIDASPQKLLHASDIWVEYVGRRDERAYTVENLEAVASNHLFDDNPSLFGITSDEGHLIRHYFSVGSETYDFIRDLREEYPTFFRHQESQEYLESANHRRKSKKLEPLLSQI